jgi:hypothetical protein
MPEPMSPARSANELVERIIRSPAASRPSRWSSRPCSRSTLPMSRSTACSRVAAPLDVGPRHVTCVIDRVAPTFLPAGKDLSRCVPADSPTDAVPDRAQRAK